jgi:peroxin-1
MLESKISTFPLKSCFVNLPDKWAQMLWTDPTMREPANVILKLKSPQVYLSWSGGSSPNDTVQIDPVLASHLSLKPNQPIQLSFVQPVAALRVFVEPVNEDSWEILELNAGWVEDNLMSQVRVLFMDQVIPVWIHSNLITLRVGI